ncbi:MAG: geranylgeranyl reductase family protein [Bacteroidetes bacterium]|nr:geranylgeranyl reductase family protein [Bacteroidota bacterium]
MASSDILILGAGPGGAATALFLAKQGIPCTLIDKAKFPRDKICGDALSGKVVEVLKKLDPTLIEQLQMRNEFLGSYGVTFVAPNGDSLRVPFKKDIGENTPPPGFISKRVDFDDWLIEQVRNQPLITLREQTEIRKYERTENGYRAIAKSGESFEANIIIAADGAGSTFTKDIAGLAVEPEHNCFGLRAYYKNVSGLDHKNFIELHFLKEFLPGYFWIFPLPGGYANIGVGMRADVMSDRKLNLKKEFEKIITGHPAVRMRFEQAEMIGDVKLHGLPLGSKKRQLSGDHYMLVGDAAMLIDPFTGEGIGNAMMSGMLAALQVSRCIATQKFDAATMAQYDKAVYDRLWSELLLSYRMQQLVNYPSIFNFVVRKANGNAVLRETIMAMFEDLDIRARLKDPRFYVKLLFS